MNSASCEGEISTAAGGGGGGAFSLSSETWRDEDEEGAAMAFMLLLFLVPSGVFFFFPGSEEVLLVNLTAPVPISALTLCGLLSSLFSAAEEKEKGRLKRLLISFLDCFCCCCFRCCCCCLFWALDGTVVQPSSMDDEDMMWALASNSDDRQLNKAEKCPPRPRATNGFVFRF